MVRSSCTICNGKVELAALSCRLILYFPGIASGSIYGPDVDFLMWDSSMTEREPEALDAFARQALLGGAKVPVLWSLFPIVAAPLHDQADVDVGCHGTGYAGIPELTKAEDVETMPWASRYVRCVGDLFGLCRENEYIGECALI